MSIGILQIRRDILSNKGILAAGEPFYDLTNNFLRIGLSSGEVAFSLSSHLHDYYSLTSHLHNYYTLTSTFVSSSAANYNAMTTATASLQSQITSISATVPKSISGAYWGSISGSLTNQSDLNTALNFRSLTSHTHTILGNLNTGNLTVSSHLKFYYDGSEYYMTIDGEDTDLNIQGRNGINNIILGDDQISMVTPNTLISQDLTVSGNLLGNVFNKFSLTSHNHALSSLAEQSYYSLTNKPNLNSYAQTSNIVGVLNKFAMFTSSSSLGSNYLSYDPLLDMHISERSFSISYGNTNTTTYAGNLLIGESNTANSNYSFVLGTQNYTHVSAPYSLVTGFSNSAMNACNFVSGSANFIKGIGTASFGFYNRSAAGTIGGFIEGGDIVGVDYNFIKAGNYGHIEGSGNQISGNYSHAEGYKNVTQGAATHVEGMNNTAEGDYSHSEGFNTYSQGSYSHASGNSTTALGAASLATGGTTVTNGDFSMATGFGSQAFRNYEYAKASGFLTKVGDSQYSNFVLQKQVNTLSPGPGGSLMDMNGSLLVLETDKVYNFRVMGNIVAANNGISTITKGDAKMVSGTGCIKNIGGTVSWIGNAPSLIQLAADNSIKSSNIALSANNTDKRLDLYGIDTGDSATYNFTAFVEWVETGI